MRPKRKADDKITAPGKVKRAKAVSDILEHFSEHSSQVKAELVPKIIDREGANFGQNVFQNSKVLKEMNQLDREDTVGLMTGTRSSEYLWRKSRTAFNKKLRFSPISKGKGCLAIATLNPTFTFLGRDFAIFNTFSWQNHYQKSESWF